MCVISISISYSLGHLKRVVNSRLTDLARWAGWALVLLRRSWWRGRRRKLNLLARLGSAVRKTHNGSGWTSRTSSVIDQTLIPSLVVNESTTQICHRFQELFLNCSLCDIFFDLTAVHLPCLFVFSAILIGLRGHYTQNCVLKRVSTGTTTFIYSSIILYITFCTVFFLFVFYLTLVNITVLKLNIIL